MLSRAPRSGELGHGGWTPIEVDVPRCVSALVGTVRVCSVVTGANHTLAVGQCGSLWACGRGRCGQLGNGDFNDTGPLQRVETLRDVPVVAAAAGGTHSLALTAAGDVWSFGDARDGRLGQGPAVLQAAAWDPGAPTPGRVQLPAWCASDPIVDVSAGGHHSLLRTASGRLLVCGRGRHGALGVGDAADRHAPVEVALHCGDASCSGASGCVCRLGGGGHSRAVAVAAGRDHSLVLTACGTVLCAGFNGHGQLGVGDTTSSSTFMRPALPRGVRMVAIAAGEGHSAAVAADGVVYLWGRGDWGQLGCGTCRSHWRPMALPSFSLLDL
jgi:alpha-tubulin suppressor-like RCC1 family protein